MVDMEGIHAPRQASTHGGQWVDVDRPWKTYVSIVFPRMGVLQPATNVEVESWSTKCIPVSTYHLFPLVCSILPSIWDNKILLEYRVKLSYSCIWHGAKSGFIENFNRGKILMSFLRINVNARYRLAMQLRHTEILVRNSRTTFGGMHTNGCIYAGVVTSPST